MKNHLTYGASRRRLWVSREARLFLGTSWIAHPRAACAVSLGVQPDCSRAVVARHEVGVLLVVVLA
jgi:hypothetical protein